MHFHPSILCIDVGFITIDIFIILVHSDNASLGDSEDSYTVLVGNREWMIENGLEVLPQIDESMIQQEEKAQTVVLAAVNGKSQISKDPSEIFL